MKWKTTSLEKKWIFYDVGNSAFTLLVSTIMPIYFNYLASSAYVSEVNSGDMLLPPQPLSLLCLARFLELSPTSVVGRNGSF